MIDENTNGFIKDLSNKEYHDNRSHVSSSVIKKAANDPQEYYRVYVLGEEPAPMNESALLVGNYTHCALLEPHLLHNAFAVYNGTRRGNEYKAFKQVAEADGKTVLGKSQYDLCQELLNGFATSKIQTGENTFIMADTLFQGGYAEESLFTELEDVKVKVRFDYRIDKGQHIIRDLKTTRDVVNTTEQVKKVIQGLDYDLSAALYLDALAKELKINADKIIYEWVFCSKADYRTNVYRASKETLEKGRIAYKKGLAQIKEWRLNGYNDIWSIREV